jgi:hypothetical protein
MNYLDIKLHPSSGEIEMCLVENYAAPLVGTSYVLSDYKWIFAYLISVPTNFYLMYPQIDLL